MSFHLLTHIQRIIPQHTLSRCSRYIADCKYGWFKNLLISWFIKKYKVDLTDAQVDDYHKYECFNDFFTRALKPETRPFPENASLIVSPCDGNISQIGKIKAGSIIQAKNHHYNVCSLLGGNKATSHPFLNGYFATIYLSPRDYHRVHMPIAGTLKKMIYIPGRLFSVNSETTKNLPNLFALNERVVSIFNTELGQMAVIMVGAMIVASIKTVWENNAVAPQSKATIEMRHYPQEPGHAIHLDRGKEMGRFQLGSTVIMLFGEDSLKWMDHLHSDQQILMGQTIAQPQMEITHTLEGIAKNVIAPLTNSNS